MKVENVIGFGYAQARVQARHGRRPSEQVWRRLRASQDLPHFLAAARAGELGNWLAGLDEKSSSREIERSMRVALLSYVELVASWVPSRWRRSFRWMRWWPYLQSLERIARNDPVPHALREDSVLSPLMLDDADQRVEAFGAAGLQALLEGLESGEGFRDAWIGAWLACSPARGRSLRELAALLGTMDEEQSSLDDEEDAWLWIAEWEQKLVKIFRRHPLQPIAIFSHLFAIALDLQKLRGALLRRALLPAVQSEVRWV